MAWRFILIIIISFSTSFANSGKVAGHITNHDDGEPLPGVNILIQELYIGAATDINGDYTIINVPPGDYTLSISAIGYKNVIIQGLRVNLDQTTRQNYTLELEIVEGEEVTVVADRPMVRKDLTASQKITTSAEIAELPVESFLGVLTTQAGVNLGADGALHIRGGRSNEVGYYINGVSVTDPFFTNSLAVNVSNKALEEMKVVSGAFNAEYGNAMSGIVNLQLKDGGRNYEGSFSAYSGDYYSDNSDIFINISDVSVVANKTLEGTFTGPVPGIKNLTFNLSGRYNNSEGYLFGIREHLPNDISDFRFDDYWYISMGGDKSYVPMNPSLRLNTLAKITYKVTPKLKFSLQLLNDWRDYKSYSHAYKYNPDGSYQYFRKNQNYALIINQAFNKSYYNLNVFISQTDYDQYVHEDPLAVYKNEDNPGYVSTNTMLGVQPSNTFYFGGMGNLHRYRDSKSTGLKFDYLNQINARHEVKTGISYRSDNLIQDEFEVLFDGFTYPVPTVDEKNASPKHTYYDQTATFFSAYIQDKIEYTSMIINAGLRYDYFAPNDSSISDLLHPESNWKESSTKNQISPRIGVSFPITDEGILHFSYGHFYQMPELRRLFQKDVISAAETPAFGYSDLKPEKTIMYEFGLQQQLSNILAIDGSMFYKDIRDLLASQTIYYISPAFGPKSYSIYLNKDYGIVKGIALSLTKRWDKVSKTSVYLDYSYQVTEGNSVNSGSFYFSALTGEEEEKLIVPLGWDQSHIINGTVTISDPKNWSLSFIGQLSTGWPYTPQIPLANYIPRPNSDRKPLQRKVNFRASKTISLSGFSLVAFLKIYNMFDALNERYVYDDTGRAGYTYANKSGQEAQLVPHYGVNGVHTWEEYQVRPSYYRAPRSVQIGFSLDF
ncbi:MAG: TonB-dependent receptor [Candidatus Marinimicrobia bacterium]|nr:TonB-dependent receptor [Candidatus Neomarinimicrobiota bacterium]